MIVPITDWKDRYGGYPWMVRLDPSSGNGLDKSSAVDCFQIRSVSTTRLLQRIGAVSLDVMSQVQAAILTVIGTTRRE